MPSLIEHIQTVGVTLWPALLLMVVGLVSAPLLVRRGLRGQAVSPTRWRSPGVELIMLCWLAFGVDTVAGLEAIRYTCGARPWAAKTLTYFILNNVQLLSLAALFVTLWTTLCVAIGARLTPIPTAAATLRDGLKAVSYTHLTLPTSDLV